MKKVYFVLSLLLLAVPCLHADFSEGYYARMDGKKKDVLKAAAKACVQNHVTLQYYELPNYWQYSDVYPDLVNGLKRWWEMYSDEQYLIQTGMSGTRSFSANRMQREHAVPKSWWKRNGDEQYTPAYSDMWNLYPSDGAANQAKLNYAFGETDKPFYNNGVTKVGPAAPGYGGGSGNVFEPADEYKGDFARAIFYMATVYDDIYWGYTWMFKTESYPTLMPWAVNMLLKWSRQDPVSQKEIDRNNIVEQYQGNRNPFVDFPNLAEYIWGISTEETFVVSEQASSDPTPPITGDPEITAPVTGESLDFGEAAVGHAVNRALEISGHNLVSPLSVRVVGANRTFFQPEVTSIPAATMNQNGGYLLNITYIPTEIGSHEARLVLYDGGLEGSIAVDLRGEAKPVPEFVTPRALEAEDVQDNSYTARWSEVAGEVDYYILHRVRYTETSQDIETYETGETYYRIEDRNPNIAESYTVSYVRLGIESPASNSVYVAASGINDIREESPYRVIPCDGGFTIDLGAGEGGELSVYSADGGLLFTAPAVTDGETYLLPPGLYLVTIANARPSKLLIR